MLFIWYYDEGKRWRRTVVHLSNHRRSFEGDSALHHPDVAAGGAILSMAADAVDVVLVNLIGLVVGESGGFRDYYQIMDKSLDIYYMSFEAFVSLRWTNHLARNSSLFLFVYRIFGMVLFEIAGIRKLLFFFPNLFENFYVYYLVANRFFPRYAARSQPQLAVILFLLFVPNPGTGSRIP